MTATRLFGAHETEAKNEVRVELYYSSAWNDITEWVRVQSPITINRGFRSPPGIGVADPGTAEFTLHNPDGRWTRLNPRSPLYGLVDIGTPARIIIVVDGSSATRYSGEISEMTTSSADGKDIITEVRCSDPLRRLARYTDISDSSLYLELVDPDTIDDLDIVAYWPMEDGITSAVPGSLWGSAVEANPPMRVLSGQTESSLKDGWYGSNPLPLMGTAVARGTVTAVDSSATEWTVWAALWIPDTIDTESECLVIRTATNLTFRISVTTDNYFAINVYDNTLSSLEAYVLSAEVTGYVRFNLEVERSGSTVDWSMSFHQQGVTSGSTVSDSFTSSTLGSVINVDPMGDDAGFAVGHVLVSSAVHSLFSSANQFNGYIGEHASARVERAAGLAGTSYLYSEIYYPLMGPQGSGSVLDLVTDTADAWGAVFGRRSQQGLHFLSENARSLRGELTLDYASTHIAMPFEVIHDDELLTNDVSVTRIGGATYTAELATGQRSTAAPPDGAGRYSASHTLRLNKDPDAASQAGWRLIVGTDDHARAEAVTIDLKAHPELVNDILTAGIQYHSTTYVGIYTSLKITGLPEWMEPGPLRLSIIGYTETIGTHTWTITFRCEPQWPHDYAILEESYSTLEARPDSADMVLYSDVSLTQTYIRADRDSGYDEWITTAEDSSAFPFDIIVDHEVMTCTAIVNLTHYQIMTVTRGVEGIQAVHSTGAEIHLATPVRIALP